MVVHVLVRHKPQSNGRPRAPALQDAHQFEWDGDRRIKVVPAPAPADRSVDPISDLQPHGIRDTLRERHLIRTWPRQSSCSETEVADTHQDPHICLVHSEQMVLAKDVRRSDLQTLFLDHLGHPWMRQYLRGDAGVERGANGRNQADSR